MYCTVTGCTTVPQYINEPCLCFAYNNNGNANRQRSSICADIMVITSKNAYSTVPVGHHRFKYHNIASWS